MHGLCHHVRGLYLGSWLLGNPLPLPGEGKRSREWDWGEENDYAALRKLLDKDLCLLCSPFDKLRANGSDVKLIKDFPFVLSPSTGSGQALSQHGLLFTVVRLAVSGEPLRQMN